MGRQLRAAQPGEDAAHRYADWDLVHLGLLRCLEETRSFRGLGGGPEPVFLALADAHLIETRPSGGRRVGGLFVPGFDQPTSVDVGALVVTDRRATFRGRARGETSEWPFWDLTAVHHDPDAPWTVLEVAGRPSVAGFFYGHADVPLVRFRLSLALAVFTGAVGALRGELQRRLADHLATRPPPPLVEGSRKPQAARKPAKGP